MGRKATTDTKRNCVEKLLNYLTKDKYSDDVAYCRYGDYLTPGEIVEIREAFHKAGCFEGSMSDMKRALVRQFDEDGMEHRKIIVITGFGEKYVKQVLEGGEPSSNLSIEYVKFLCHKYKPTEEDKKKAKVKYRAYYKPRKK